MLDIVLGIGDIGVEKSTALVLMELIFLEEKRPKINKQVNKRGEKVIIENKKGKGIEGDRGRQDGSGILLVSLIR